MSRSAEALRRRPALSVVVIGYRNEATIVRAVESVRSQHAEEPFEVVVVTSGGDASAARVRAFPDVAVIEAPTRLLPGGARNAGLAASKGRFVSFLAADCEAPPGWVAGRLRAHRSGHPVVAGAMTSVGRSASALASLFLLYSARLPGRPAGRVAWPDPAAHSLSYQREVLERLRGFDESLLIGEDTQAARRLGELGVEIWFEPSVRTAHSGPRTLAALVADQYGRGARAARAMAGGSQRDGSLRVTLAQEARGLRALLPWILRTASRHRPGTTRLGMVALVPWITAGAVAHRAGRVRALSERGRARARAPTGALATEPLPVTVVVPVFNRSTELPRALASVAAQQPARPAEVLVVDDGSDDGSAEVAKRLGVRVIDHRHNRGASAARNTGVAAARYPWVAFLDSDDEWLPDHLASLWPLRRGHVLAASSGLRCGGRKPRIQGTVGRRPKVLRSAAPLAFPHNRLGTSATLVRRDAFERAGGFSEELRLAEDLDLWYRLLEQGTGILTPRVTALYWVDEREVAMGDMLSTAASITESYAHRPWLSGAQLERRRAVVIWDALRSGKRSDRLTAALELAYRPQRVVGLMLALAYRAGVRRRSAALVRAKEAFPGDPAGAGIRSRTV